MTGTFHRLINFPGLVGIGLLLLTVTASPFASAGWQRDAQSIMGTSISAEVWHQDDGVARDAVAVVMQEMRRIDRLMSTWKPDTEISQVNVAAAAGEVSVSAELLALVQRSLEFSRLTEGAFDITYASAGYLYDYRNGKRPTEAELGAALPAIDYRHVVVNAAGSTLRFKRAGVKIDLGGIAKGHAIDRALALLRAAGIKHALVAAGGDTGLLGDRRGRPWFVGVRDPRNRDRIIAELPLADEAISTSGDYERYFEEDGVRYHHILNPGTGKSAGEVRSVTIIGPDATTTDALSTSVFVMGVKRGLRLIDSLSGIEAAIVDADGKLHYSAGLRRATGAKVE